MPSGSFPPASWMTSPMSQSQYPPPPPPDQSHYNPLYPPAPSQQLLDPGQQEQLHYPPPPLAPPLYPKLDHALADPNNHVPVSHNPLLDQRVAGPPPGDANAQKSNRLRKACDSCSIRKVKCDESGPPCRACAALDIPCTFDRPSRRRGPPNRHAEAIKKRRLESPGGISGTSSPSSPTNAAHALASLSSHPTLSAESICSLDIVELLINDFFTYIHPLCPFPHEPTFRDAFSKREDYTNRPFLALLASMIGVLVASFPRKPREHLKALHKEHLFPTHMALVTRCQQVCSAARGVGYLDSPDLTVYDACTSYFQGLAYGYTFRWPQSRLYFNESIAIMRCLGLHRGGQAAFTVMHGTGANGSSVNRSREQPLDKITEQVGRRLFWTLFVGVRTMQQFGTAYGDFIILPPTPSEPYPPLPEEVDDIYVYPTHIEKQKEGVVPLLSGFLANVRVYSSYEPLVTAEMAYGAGEIFDWERQKRLLDQSLRNCKSVLENLPPELTVWAAGNQPTQPSQSYYPPVPDYMGPRDPALPSPYDTHTSLEEIRKMQYEIQKANIYVSQLCTRSYIVEKFFNMSEAQKRIQAQQGVSNSPGVVATGLDSMLQQSPSSDERMEEDMNKERESIIKDLLFVLQNINQVNMEPNGDSITSKIRQIASTLLDVPSTRKGSVAVQAESYLVHFLDILNKLEKIPPAESDPNRPQSEEDELKHWSDLREYQLKFQEAGGISGFA